MSGPDDTSLVADQAAGDPEGEVAEGPRERSPATIGLGLAWVLVYLAMALCQGTLHARGQAALSGGVEGQIAHEFGTVAPAEVRGGEPWRALTATFIHFSLFHLGFNLLMFYQLGREIESWYGGWIMLGVYVVIGLGSNLLSIWLKPMFGPSLLGPSAGGSGVVCGQIALVAVVGWRSGTRTGAYLRAQMVGLLVFVAIVGLLIPGVDNIVHGSGAFMGALVGFAHKRLWPLRGTRIARAIGLTALALIVASALAQARVGYVESRAQTFLRASQRRLQAIEAVSRLDQIHLQLLTLREASGRLGPMNPYFYLALRRQFELEWDRLEREAPELGQGSTKADLERLRRLKTPALKRLPTPEERKPFVEAGQRLINRLEREQVAEEAAFRRLLGRLGMPDDVPLQVVRVAPATGPNAGPKQP